WNASAQALVASIGAPLEGAQVRIADAHGATLPSGEVGEICLRGAGVIPAYVGSHGEGGAFDDLGWLATVYMGYRGSDGLIHVMGGEKDMFVRGGYHVDPSEVEAVIVLHPEVVVAAGFGGPDMVHGEVGRYHVVRRPGSVLDA